MSLCQSYYIDKRKSDGHIDLNGEWEFCWSDVALNDAQNLVFEHKCNMPSSVYHCLHNAGVLSNPYKGVNCNEYDWVDEKVWYFRKKFSLDKTSFNGNAFLCFEGVSYYSKLWLNGDFLGEHEGMFGGPCVDVAEKLCLEGENELIVEIKACNYGKKQGYDFWNRKGENTAIVPWNIVRDTSTSNGKFIVLGIFNDVRLEFVPKLHLSRPYLYNEGVSNSAAKLQFEVEIADGTINELRQFFGIRHHLYDYTRAYDSGNTGAVRDEKVQIEIKICDGDKTAFYSKDEVPLTDFENLGMDKRFHELQFYKKEIVIDNPKLWYPNGMGEPFLYDVTVNLLYGGKTVDTHSFSHGIRMFTASYTKGNKYRNRWGKFLFTINGQERFLKGMNWTPIDFLFDVSPDRYEWCLKLVKNAGIQLIRVWNGGGMPETDLFYDICDRLGILVWQDLFLANSDKNAKYPHDVLESQTAYNLYRIRNHCSLVVLCGGNEFNPYTEDNAAAMFVMERTIQMLTPDRVYYYTTADQGSAHIYLDIEPVWYRHRYKQLPFLAESGIHSFPRYKTLKKYIRKEEFEAPICDLSSKTFREDFPELLKHMSEYGPERVPRMMARNSQILDLNKASLEDLCEASQVQVYEFYQLMIQSMQENFPVCGGVMPWVFKRPWVTVGIQTVDGDDRPGFGYYAVKNSYSPINVCWCQEWSVLAPYEEISLKVKVFNQNNDDLCDCVVSLKVLGPDMTEFTACVSPYNEKCDFGKIALTDEFTNKCFLVYADIHRGKETISRSVYFNKCTDLLSKQDVYEKYRTTPAENLYFTNGPWLKPCVEQAKQADISAMVLKRGFDGQYHYAEVLIKNNSKIPAYPVTIDVCDDEQRCMLSDNFFLLEGNEERIVRVTADKGVVGDILISLWNGRDLVVS